MITKITKKDWIKIGESANWTANDIPMTFNDGEEQFEEDLSDFQNTPPIVTMLNLQFDSGKNYGNFSLDSYDLEALSGFLSIDLESKFSPEDSDALTDKSTKVCFTFNLDELVKQMSDFMISIQNKKTDIAQILRLSNEDQTITTEEIDNYSKNFIFKMKELFKILDKALSAGESTCSFCAINRLTNKV